MIEPVVSKGIDNSLKVLSFFDIVRRAVITHFFIAINTAFLKDSDLKNVYIVFFFASLQIIQVVGTADCCATLPNLAPIKAHSTQQDAEKCEENFEDIEKLRVQHKIKSMKIYFLKYHDLNSQRRSLNAKRV